MRLVEVEIPADRIATPPGSLTPADAPLIDAEILFRQSGPAQSEILNLARMIEGFAPLFVELCESVVAVNYVRRHPSFWTRARTFPTLWPPPKCFGPNFSLQFVHKKFRNAKDSL